MVLLTLLQWEPVDLIAIPPTPFNLHLDTAVVRAVGWGGGVVTHGPSASAPSEKNNNPLEAFQWRMDVRSFEVKCQKCVQVLENGNNTF